MKNLLQKFNKKDLILAAKIAFGWGAVSVTAGLTFVLTLSAYGDSLWYGAVVAVFMLYLLPAFLLGMLAILPFNGGLFNPVLTLVVLVILLSSPLLWTFIIYGIIRGVRKIKAKKKKK